MENINWVFIGIIIGIIAIALLTYFVHHLFIKRNEQYALQQSSSQKTGAEVAKMILAKKNITNVQVLIGQENKDHFNPTTNQIFLSPSVYNSSSVSAMAIAAHETGHAIQWSEKNLSIRIRDSIAKPVSIIAQIGQSIFFFAFFFMFFVGQSWLIWLSIGSLAVFGAMGVFQFVTLPVEFGASRKAKKELASLGLMVTDNDKKGTKSVLNAAAMTYVVAFLTSAIVIFFFLLQLFLMTRR